MRIACSLAAAGVSMSSISDASSLEEAPWSPRRFVLAVGSGWFWRQFEFEFDVRRGARGFAALGASSSSLLDNFDQKGSAAASSMISIWGSLTTSTWLSLRSRSYFGDDRRFRNFDRGFHGCNFRGATSSGGTSISIRSSSSTAAACTGSGAARLPAAARPQLLRGEARPLPAPWLPIHPEIHFFRWGGSSHRLRLGRRNCFHDRFRLDRRDDCFGMAAAGSGSHRCHRDFEFRRWLRSFRHPSCTHRVRYLFDLRVPADAASTTGVGSTAGVGTCADAGGAAGSYSTLTPATFWNRCRSSAKRSVLTVSWRSW